LIESDADVAEIAAIERRSAAACGAVTGARNRVTAESAGGIAPVSRATDPAAERPVRSRFGRTSDTGRPAPL